MTDQTEVAVLTPDPNGSEAAKQAQLILDKGDPRDAAESWLTMEKNLLLKTGMICPMLMFFTPSGSLMMPLFMEADLRDVLSKALSIADELRATRVIGGHTLWLCPDAIYAEPIKRTRAWWKRFQAEREPGILAFCADRDRGTATRIDRIHWTGADKRPVGFSRVEAGYGLALEDVHQNINAITQIGMHQNTVRQLQAARSRVTPSLRNALLNGTTARQPTTPTGGVLLPGHSAGQLFAAE